MCQMRECVFELQFLHTGGNLQKVVQLDVALSTKVDFAQDVVGDFLVICVAHASHGVEQVVLRDVPVVIEIELFKGRLQGLDLVGGELGSHVQVGLVHGSDTLTGDGEDRLFLDVLELETLQVLWERKDDQ